MATIANTDSLNLFDCTPRELASRIQKQIKEELGLSTSIGISFGKTLAKLGSDMKKPMGLTEITHDNHIDIIKKLKIVPTKKMITKGFEKFTTMFI